MKKNIFKWSFYYFFILAIPCAVSAQTPVKKPISADELKQLNSETVLDNPLAKLSAAQKADGKDKAQALLAYTFKAILYKDNPSKYPLDENESSPQSVVLAAIKDKDISSYTFNKLKDRVDLLMKDATKRSLLLGKFKDIDFTKRSIHADIRRITPIDARPAMMIKDKDQASLQFADNISQGVGGSISGEKLPAFNKLDLVLRAVHCVDETNPETPGDDDIIVGGIIIGASGNVAKARSIVSCHFDDGGYCNHGSIPFGNYNLNSTSSYPKTFYAIIQLIEADSDEQEAAHALSEVMGIAAAALAGTGYGAALAVVAAAVEVFSSFFFDDDAFHPYGVTVSLPNQNTFGSDGRSSNWATGGISDHGGTYKLGFYWQMKN
ncbi:MAG: hypothetical protein ABIR30_07705 [Chitinophagaceae bacterium]